MKRLFTHTSIWCDCKDCANCMRVVPLSWAAQISDRADENSLVLTVLADAHVHDECAAILFTRNDVSLHSVSLTHICSALMTPGT